MEKIKLEKVILSFLQKRKLELYKQIPGFVDAYLDEVDGETFLTIKTEYPIEEEIDLSFQGVNIPVKKVFQKQKNVEKVIEKEKQKAVIMSASEEEGPIPEKTEPISDTEDGLGTVSIPGEVSIGPFQTDAKNSSSLEAWKKRHKAIRIK